MINHECENRIPSHLSSHSYLRSLARDWISFSLWGTQFPPYSSLPFLTCCSQESKGSYYLCLVFPNNLRTSWAQLGFSFLPLAETTDSHVSPVWSSLCFNISACNCFSWVEVDYSGTGYLSFKAGVEDVGPG